MASERFKGIIAVSRSWSIERFDEMMVLGLGLWGLYVVEVYNQDEL